MKDKFNVYRMFVEDLNYSNKYDKIWDSASHLHVRRINLNENIEKMLKSSKKKMVLQRYTLHKLKKELVKF